jgi:hypothetical protein
MIFLTFEYAITYMKKIYFFHLPIGAWLDHWRFFTEVPEVIRYYLKIPLYALWIPQPRIIVSVYRGCQ